MKWDQRFLKRAREIASWSRDPSTQVGAVIVDSLHRERSSGYNGFPRAMPDNPEWYEDREIKYRYIVHAEANALANLAAPISDFTLYVWPMAPCNTCMGLLLQYGVKRIVTVSLDHPRFAEGIAYGQAMAGWASVPIDVMEIEDCS